jgi:hypothetical protein
MPEDSVIQSYFQKNVPIATNQNVPLSELGPSSCRRRYIPKKKVEELAIEKYRTTGAGIVFTDITRAFPCSKNKAQRILKDCCNVHRPLLFRSFKRTSPQQSCRFLQMYLFLDIIVCTHSVFQSFVFLRQFLAVKRKISISICIHYERRFVFYNIQRAVNN